MMYIWAIVMAETQGKPAADEVWRQEQIASGAAVALAPSPATNLVVAGTGCLGSGQGSAFNEENIHPWITVFWGTTVRSMWSLCSICTLDGWAEKVRPFVQGEKLFGAAFLMVFLILTAC